MDRLQAHRSFYADLVTEAVGVGKGRIREAFATVPREHFVGDGPWDVTTGSGYVRTPSNDPAFLYQDVLVALAKAKSINNGQPSLHALSLAALNIQQGETAVHIGAGTGYYTAVLSQLVGPTGFVFAYEVEHNLARLAIDNLSDYRNVAVYDRSGADSPIPDCDAVYVSAGATAPLDIWLDALRPLGRLLFPLTPAEGFGGMLLVARGANPLHWEARFLTRAMFIPCLGARDDKTAQNLSLAFEQRSIESVRALCRHSPPDESCWVAGEGWWLSTAEAEYCARCAPGPSTREDSSYVAALYNK